MALLKKCKCGKTISQVDGLCDECKQLKQHRDHKRYDSKRGTSTQRGYDSRWRKYRLNYLKQNPLCVKCLDEGYYVPATVVDHIVPHKGDNYLFWDTNNHQALCKHHHDMKTASEDGGFGNTIKNNKFDNIRQI